MASPTCFADEVQEEFNSDCAAAETLLRDIVKQNRQITPAEYAFLGRLGWDEIKAREQRRRVSAAMTFAPICGSPEMRKATQEEAKKAASIASKEIPKLDEEIAKLQAKRDAFERDASLSAKRVQQQNDAVVRLREMVPLHIKIAVGKAETELNTKGIGKDLREAKQRHHELSCILNKDGVYKNQHDHLTLGLKRLLPEAVVQGLDGRSIVWAYSATWLIHKVKCEAEFALLNSRLPKLQEAYDKALAIVLQPLDYYSDPAIWEND